VEASGDANHNAFCPTPGSGQRDLVSGACRESPLQPSALPCGGVGALRRPSPSRRGSENSMGHSLLGEMGRVGGPSPSLDAVHDIAASRYIPLIPPSAGKGGGGGKGRLSPSKSGEGASWTPSRDAGARGSVPDKVEMVGISMPHSWPKSSWLMVSNGDEAKLVWRSPPPHKLSSEAQPVMGRMARGFQTHRWLERPFSFLHRTGREHLRPVDGRKPRHERVVSFISALSSSAQWKRHETMGLIPLTLALAHQGSGTLLQKKTPHPCSPLRPRGIGIGKHGPFSPSALKGTGGMLISRRQGNAVRSVHVPLISRARAQSSAQDGPLSAPRRETPLLWREPPEAANRAAKPEEPEVMQRVPAPGPATRTAQPATAAGPTLDFIRLADQVYAMVERKFRVERARRGL
jgi:hypothetical protein